MKGTFAKVILVKEKTTNQILVMKILKKKNIEHNHQDLHLMFERNVPVSVQHPFIVKLHYSF